MEGIERLSLTNNGLVDDAVLSYTPEQLFHHEAAQALLTHPPLEGTERWI
jgi:hypothetical protein